MTDIDEIIGNPEVQRAARLMRACECDDAEHIGRIVAGNDDNLPRASAAVCHRPEHHAAARTWATQLTGHPTAEFVPTEEPFDA